MSNTFKLIVVGGGPVGLIAAHALQLAGIDFVVLERRTAAVIDAGSNLVLSPQGLGVLNQLGVGQAIELVSSPLGLMNRMDHRGRSIGSNVFFTQMKKSYGCAPRVISRHDLTKVLYDALPSEARERILCNKKLSNVVSTADGITATCADGSTYDGTALIGADGAHSSVRASMRHLAQQAGSTQLNDENPFLTTYQALWIRFPKRPDLAVGATSETHGSGAATQLFMGEESGVLGLYEPLPKPTQERLRHTEADRDALVQRWADLPVIPGSNVTLRDLYTSRLEAGLVSLEEGTLPYWSWNGRIVLAGDAAHKFTPSTGAGCNNGMMDVVVLVNALHEMLKSSANPTHEQLGAVFGKYQGERENIVASECAQSGNATATATWQTSIHKFVDRRVLSLHPVQRYLISSGAKSSQRQAPTCQFVSTRA